MHLVGALCAAATPALGLLAYIGSGGDSDNLWALKRIDIVVLIFCVLAVILLLASFMGARRSLCLAAAALLFASFGLVLAFPLEFPALVDGAQVKIGGYLTPIVALIGAGAAVFAAESVPTGAGDAPIGAGRGATPAITAPLAAPAPTGAPQAPAGAGGAQPGWYADPHGQARLRYFDGREWTQQTSN
jgi:hypothetical protein